MHMQPSRPDLSWNQAFLSSKKKNETCFIQLSKRALSCLVYYHQHFLHEKVLEYTVLRRRGAY
jgi:hypothetical protein